MYKIFLIFIIGYITAATGLFLGAVITMLLNDYGKRLKNIGMAFTGGLLVSFICFEILSNAMSISGIYIVIGGALAGVLLTVYLETKAKKIDFGLAIMMCIAILFHNLPEGIALGSMLAGSLNSGIMFAVILAIHCLPEGITLSSYLKKGGLNSHKIMTSSFILAIPMGIGSFIGAALNSVSPYFLSITMSLAGGTMLYITCGEILPQSQKATGIVTTFFAAAIGFAIGSFIVCTI